MRKTGVEGERGSFVVDGEVGGKLSAKFKTSVLADFDGRTFLAHNSPEVQTCQEIWAGG